MLEKLFFVLRGVTINIKNCGRVHLPIHSRIGKGANIFTSNGRIKFGYGVVTASNTSFSALDGGVMNIGNRVFVNRNCIFICRKNISIGDHCSFGPNVCIYDHDHDYGPNGMNNRYKYGDVTIGNHCWIGAGVIILRGSNIGEGCVIGAGCIVKGTIPAHSMVISGQDLIIRKIEGD